MYFVCPSKETESRSDIHEIKGREEVFHSLPGGFSDYGASSFFKIMHRGIEITNKDKRGRSGLVQKRKNGEPTNFFIFIYGRHIDI